MKTRREIVKFLCDEFVDLACENCECKNTKYCAGCDLENCNWEISEKAADRIAGEILEEQMAKKYYWLKMKKDFFKRHDIRIV